MGGSFSVRPFFCETGIGDIYGGDAALSITSRTGNYPRDGPLAIPDQLPEGSCESCDRGRIFALGRGRELDKKNGH